MLYNLMLRLLHCIGIWKSAFSYILYFRLQAYLHGGLLKYPSENVPLSNVVVFDPSTLTLSAVKSVNEGPAR